MRLKFLLGLLIPILLAAACSSPATSVTTATAVPAPMTATTAPSDIPSPVPATKAVSVPKQRDLLFVEFFSVT